MSASEVTIHKEALYQVYLPLPFSIVIAVCYVCCNAVAAMSSGHDDWSSQHLDLSLFDDSVYANSACTYAHCSCLSARAGSRVDRIDPLHFLAGCRKRRLNQVLYVLSLSLGFLSAFMLCC